ncbi:aldehyde ferredoxin oxidoreductase family protein [Chloroflexota bacterium]
MAEFFGYAGSRLEVDLSKGSIRKIPLEEGLVEKFIGGIGFSTKIIYDLMEPKTDAFGAENVFAIGSSPLSGTLAPTATRAEFAAKSPESGLFSWANTGGSVSNMLKYAGYDHLAITGAADKPVYLMISDDDMEIRDASHLWGKDTWETDDILKAELGKEYVITCTGPAGERLVKFATPVSNKHSVGARTGLGAVMGSKKLKAIAVRGTKGVKVANKKNFLALVKEATKRFEARENLVQAWRTYGFLAGFKGMYDEEEFFKHMGGYYACQSCPIADNAWINIKEGKYAGLSYLASAPGTKLLIATKLPGTPGFEHYDDMWKWLELVNRWGIDAMATIAMLNLIRHLYENKVIIKEDIDGLDPTRNDPEMIMALTRKMAYREGFGDILAEGMHRACAMIGKGAEEYDISIKGVDAETATGGALGATETLGYITNSRPAFMERSTSISFAKRKRESYVAYCKSIGVPEEVIDRLCDGPENLNPPRLLRYVEDIQTLIAMQGLCRRAPVSQVWDLAFHADFYSAATGREATPKGFLKAAERVWNLQKCFNMREGATRKDDRFPKQLLPMTLGGIVVDETTIDRLLNEYYEERGWDVEKGIPTKKKLTELGLEDVAKELEERGLLT